MNRIKLNVIKETTSVPINELKQIIVVNPYSSGWLSEKFPVYPILINFHVSNPPFNRISISLQPPFLPKCITLQGSSDCKEFFKFAELKEYTDPTNIVLNLQEIHHYEYVRLRVDEPVEEKVSTSKTNICRQIWVKCIEITFVSFYDTEYACSMKKAMQLDPYLFRTIELLEYKALLAKSKCQHSSKAEQLLFQSKKYFSQIQHIFEKLKQWKENPKRLSQSARERLMNEFEVLSKEPIESTDADLQYDRQAILSQMQMLQNELADFYIHRLNGLHKDVTDYFFKYWNRQVKEEYMRLLSSPDTADHGRALSNFWSEVRELSHFPPNIEEAVVMFFNYFLEYLHQPLKIAAIKILCLLFKSANLTYDIYFVYERLLFNLFSQMSDQENEELFSVALKCIYTLYQKVPNKLFIEALVNPEHSVKLSMKLSKLEILEKVTFHNVTIDEMDMNLIVDYLLSILMMRDLSLKDKNRAYNVVAYLASLFGKEAVMAKLQKLNTMLLMNMEKVVDKKLQLMKGPKKEDDTPSCEYCGVVKQSFRDRNVYDLHCFSDCKYLTPCRYCSQIIEIPQLSKHYIHTCQQRNLFKECDDCNEVIVKDKQNEHKSVCTKMLQTKCGLCGQKMEGKLKLKQHILKDGCPNNPR